MSQAQPRKPYVVKREEDKPAPVAPPSRVTQNQLVEILTLEEEARMIRHEILMKKLKIASAVLAGATIESGRHECVYDRRRGRVHVHAFRGAIMRHSPNKEEGPDFFFQPSTV